MNHLAFGSIKAGSAPGHIAMIGNASPRRCGIATFTEHCAEALRDAFPDIRIDRYAMDDGAGEVKYAPGIHLIDQRDPASYAEAADMIERSGASAIWLQHEFGIFGGSAGECILRLLDRTRLPLITTLHTVLARPNEDERRVMDAVLARSAQVIIMAEHGRAILRDVYGVADTRIVTIPHGVPDRAYVDPAEMKPQFGWEGRPVVLTFGLLAPDKGIDSMIRALPAVVARHPDVLYVVLGASHPNYVRDHGETLRESLVALAAELGVTRNIEWVDRYLDQEELLDRLQAADIYVTPYLNPAQITSGTLSYAIGMGKATVSTPYIHATEILDQDHGILVPFRGSEAMATAITALLDDPAMRRDYADRAYARGRSMLWRELALRAGQMLADARAHRPIRLPVRHSYAILKPDLSAVLRMSDAVGMLQHAIFSVPDRDHGYCLDDNARALILMSQIEACDADLRDRWLTIYESFVQHAWNPRLGRFRNFMRFDRSWCEEEGSEDSCGRGLWSIGVTARDATVAKHRDWAVHMFDRCLQSLRPLQSPRAQAFAILGAVAFLDARPGHAGALAIVQDYAPRIAALVDTAARDGWTWFEPVLGYDNARLPEALIRAGRAVGNRQWLDRGLATLGWLTEQQTAPEGHFRPVGHESFGREYASPLPFDQQPLEAQATVEAAEAAHSATGDAHWLDIARDAYRWFLGANDLSQVLATRDDGGCYDGLTPNGPNRNQGAESILALQLSSCVMNRLCERAETMADGPSSETNIIA